jgi:hypothetical protein
MPFAGAIMAAAQAGWSMKLDRPTGGERNKGRQRLDTGRPRPNPRVPGPIMNDQAPAAAEHAPFPPLFASSRMAVAAHTLMCAQRFKPTPHWPDFIVLQPQSTLQSSGSTEVGVRIKG